jgi:hypothetical protein
MRHFIHTWALRLGFSFRPGPLQRTLEGQQKSTHTECISTWRISAVKFLQEKFQLVIDFEAAGHSKAEPLRMWLVDEPVRAGRGAYQARIHLLFVLENLSSSFLGLEFSFLFFLGNTVSGKNVLR